MTLFCQKCRAPNDGNAKFCSACGEAIIFSSAPTPQSNSFRESPNKVASQHTTQNKKVSLGKQLLALCFLGFVVAGILAVLGVGEKKQDVNAFQGKTYLVYSKVHGIDAYRTEESLEKAFDAISNHDEIGLFQASVEGDALVLVDGTRVLVLDRSELHGWCKVRLLSEPNYGEVVYLMLGLTRFDVDSHGGN